MAVRNCYTVDVADIDFSKAFDSVCHSKLIRKLEVFGIGGKLLFWIKDYLSDRTQAVKVANKLSSFCSVRSGVPQGSVLGPLLFLVYINDLVEVFGNFLMVKLFADDVKIYVVVDNDTKVAVLQEDLNKLQIWSEKWQLILSSHKCSVLHIGNKNNNSVYHSYNVNNVQLIDNTATVDLGVIIDGKLRFDKHIANIVSKAHSRAALIRRCFKSRDSCLLFRAFTVFVRPLLEYCSPVSNPHHHCDIEKIESIQRRFAKYIGGFKKLSYRERLLRLNAETLESRRLKVI